MGSKLPIAVVGVGRIGGLHAHNAANSDIMDLVAVVDTNLKAAEEVAKELNVPHRFTSIDELVNANIARAAVVASPTNYHVEHSLVLLNAGYKVLLEKPLSHDLESAAEIMEYLGDTRDRLMQAFMRRFDPPYLYARRLIKDGNIGKIYRIDSMLEDSELPPKDYVSPGILIDMGVHNVDEILWLMGKSPEKLIAVGHKLNKECDDKAYDYANLHLTFSDDGVGIITVARKHVAGYHVETRVYGTKGNIYIGQFDRHNSGVTLRAFGRNNQLLEEHVSKIQNNNSKEPEFITRFRKAYRAELEYFATRCLANKPFSVNQFDGMRAMKIAVKGQQYLDNHKEIICL